MPLQGVGWLADWLVGGVSINKWPLTFSNLFNSAAKVFSFTKKQTMPWPLESPERKRHKGLNDKFKCQADIIFHKMTEIQNLTLENVLFVLNKNALAKTIREKMFVN